MSGNNKERDKSARERGIFLEFARVSPLNIDPVSVQSEKPPKPDINCKIDRQIHFFELAEITDNGVAHSLAIALKEMRPTGGAFSQHDPLIRTFLSKANKGYEVGAHSLELLAYCDKQYPPIDAAAFIQAHVGGIAESMRVFGRWTRFWIYDTWNKRIIWVYPRRGA